MIAEAIVYAIFPARSSFGLYMSQAHNLEYAYDTATTNASHAYLLPVVDEVVNERRPKRVFDLGCGNGSVANHISDRCEVTGIDPSASAVRIANETYPHLKIDLGSAYDALPEKYGVFDLIVSLEVVEHVYDPRRYAQNLFDLLRPGGAAVVSTPYHGYLKNCALALSGQLDHHFTALWDGGHIKFWSIKTLTQLLTEVGFVDIQFRRVGRIPALAKSMIAIASRASDKSSGYAIPESRSLRGMVKADDDRGR